MSDSGGISEDQSADGNADSKVCAHRREDSAGNWTKGHSYYILTKILSTFCLCPETLNEAELESNGLTRVYVRYFVTAMRKVTNTGGLQKPSKSKEQNALSWILGKEVT
jgi:hypothetical protein